MDKERKCDRCGMALKNTEGLVKEPNSKSSFFKLLIGIPRLSKKVIILISE